MMSENIKTIDLRLTSCEETLKEIKEDMKELKSSLIAIEKNILELQVLHKAKRNIFENWKTWLVIVVTVGGLVFEIYQHFKKG